VAAKLVVDNLHKRYGPIEAARGVSFDVQEGEIFGLIGPNGAGKTTTVECVLGLREPDSGRIEVCGFDARRRPQDAKQRVGAALQSTALQDKITPREALVLFGALYRDADAPEPLLERFALTEKADAAFDTLSGGQRQRLALALAFVNRPELVVLDEPTSGLDPQARRDLHDAILGMKRDGHTVLLTTHQLAEAETLCDRIAIIDRGAVIASDTPRAIIARSQALQSVHLVTSSPVDRDALAQLPDVRDIDGDGCDLRLRTTHASRTLAALTARLEAVGVEIVELHVQKATLEDVFLELTARGRDARKVR
jgi:ABC-2 type transport system ATP-binding protein